MAENDRNGTTRIGFPVMRYKERKEHAVAFYKENKIPEVLEKMLNKMYLARPNDLYGYIVRKCVTKQARRASIFTMSAISLLIYTDS